MLKKYFIPIFVLSGLLFAVDVPLQKIITTEVALGEWTVFDLPFKITDASPTSFKSRYDIEEITEDAEKISGGTDYLDESLPPVSKAAPAVPKGATKGTKTKKTKAIFIKRSSHTISIYPKKFGETNILIWGHKSYPVMLKIKVVPSKKGSAYIKFLDYEEAQEEAAVLEKTSHEKIIVTLTKYLYKRKTPKGYSSTSSGRTYRNGKIRMKLVRSIIGKEYRGDEWLVKNTYKTTKKLYEEIFYNDGIYSVSLENDVLKPKETTRLFVIRKVK